MNKHQKHVKRCEALAGVLQAIGNVALDALERGEIEGDPIAQIRKAIDKLEAEHYRRTGMTVAEAAKKMTEERRRKDEAEGVIH